MQNPERLIVAEKAHRLAVQAYRVVEKFPRNQQYGLTSQIQRAAVSVGSNIAEGCGRSTDREMAVFLHYALGSAAEMEFQLGVALELQFGEPQEVKALIQDTVRIKRMLGALLRYLRKPQ